jgi:prepilin-type N-terminal cleavage/methylation domain-containing protein
VKKDATQQRFLREEDGFTLPEMLTTIVIMIVVLFALYSIFDMSLRVFSFGNNKVEAVESARVGLEKMEREIRGAYRKDSTVTSRQDHLFFTIASPSSPLAVPPTTVTQLTFGNDLGNAGAANGKIECGTPCEYITYKLSDANNGTCTATATPPCTLRRVNTANSSDLGDPVVENVALNGLSFTFYKSDGGTPTNESEIGIVLVSLNIIVDKGIGNPGTQKLTTAVDLRNR